MFVVVAGGWILECSFMVRLEKGLGVENHCLKVGGWPLLTAVPGNCSGYRSRVRVMSGACETRMY